MTEPRTLKDLEERIYIDSVVGNPPVDPIVMRVFREWERTGATLDQIEAFRALLDTHKIDPTCDLYANLTMACCAYTDACGEATCAAWLRFEELPGWQDDVVKWFDA